MSIDWSALEIREVPDTLLRQRRTPATRISRCDCVNCDASFGPPRCRRTPYCSVRCHDQAKAVRYTRAKLREYGGNLPIDIQVAIRMKIAHGLASGYDATARHLPPERRQEVWTRDYGRCILCQAAGEEIDHIDGPSDELSNLRLLCGACHRKVTERHLVRITDPETLAERGALLRRVYAAEPERPCDADDWGTRWREWLLGHGIYE